MAERQKPDWVDIAVDEDGDLAIDENWGDVQLASGEDVAEQIVNEVIATGYYEFAGAAFWGNYLYLYVNSPDIGEGRGEIKGAVRVALLNTGMVDMTSIKTTFTSEGIEVEFKTLYSKRPRRVVV